MQTSPDYEAYELKCAAFQALRTNVRLFNRKALFDALQAGGVRTVGVSFDGSGDSGQIEGIHGESHDGETVSLQSLQVEVQHIAFEGPSVSAAIENAHDLIESMAYDHLAETHQGWENNDGGFGTFSFDVDERTITLELNERYVDYTHHFHEF